MKIAPLALNHAEQYLPCRVVVRARENMVEAPVSCLTHRGSRCPETVLKFLLLLRGNHVISFIIFIMIINTEGFWLYTQITIRDTTGASLSLANNQLISSRVEISIKQQRNISTAVWQMQMQSYREKEKLAAPFLIYVP